MYARLKFQLVALLLLGVSSSTTVFGQASGGSYYTGGGWWFICTSVSIPGYIYTPAGSYYSPTSSTICTYQYLGNGGYGGGGSGGGGSGGGGSGDGGGIGPIGGENPDELSCGSDEAVLSAYCSASCPVGSYPGESCSLSIGRGAYELSCVAVQRMFTYDWNYSGCTINGDVIPTDSDAPPETDKSPEADTPPVTDKSS